MKVSNVRINPLAGWVILFYLAVLHLRCWAGSPAITNVTLTPTGPRLTIMSEVGITNQSQTLTRRSQGNRMEPSSLVVTQSPYRFVDTLTGPGPQRYYRVMAFNA